MVRRDDEDRLLLSAKLALAGFLVIVFALFGTFALLGPLIDPRYKPDPVLLVPLGTATLGAILMLVGIQSRFWKNGGD